VTAATQSRVESVQVVWPLFRIRLRTPRLELRPVDDGLIAALSDIARDGVHPTGASPFANGWTDRASYEWDRGFAQYFWAQRGNWSSDSWALPFAVVLDGVPIGVQQITADRFRVRRTVGTGSWLSIRHQRQGIGTEMREAVLHLAFDYLAADLAITGAFPTAAGSIRVSEKIGYLRNGTRRDDTSRGPVDSILFRLPRQLWYSRERTPVEVEGFQGAEAHFGVGRDAQVASVSPSCGASSAIKQPQRTTGDSHE
jgi:RimJ/RimL family protein N-acetyltransferase